jgi:hypothetical protein
MQGKDIGRDLEHANPANRTKAAKPSGVISNAPKQSFLSMCLSMQK